MNSKHLSILAAIAAAVCISSSTAQAQVTSTSGDVSANERPNIALAQGVMKVNGVLYVVSAGIAKRVDLADGQMATLEGLVRPIPPNATLPGGVPQATISDRAATPRTPLNTTATGATDTPQSERNRGIGDPTPGASNSTGGRP